MRLALHLFCNSDSKLGNRYELLDDFYTIREVYEEHCLEENEPGIMHYLAETEEADSYADTLPTLGAESQASFE